VRRLWLATKIVSALPTLCRLFVDCSLTYSARNARWRAKLYVISKTGHVHECMMMAAQCAPCDAVMRDR
jgi:hypothetical protein